MKKAIKSCLEDVRITYILGISTLCCLCFVAGFESAAQLTPAAFIYIKWSAFLITAITILNIWYNIVYLGYVRNKEELLKAEKEIEAALDRLAESKSVLDMIHKEQMDMLEKRKEKDHGNTKN